MKTLGLNIQTLASAGERVSRVQRGKTRYAKLWLVKGFAPDWLKCKGDYPDWSEHVR